MTYLANIFQRSMLARRTRSAAIPSSLLSLPFILHTIPSGSTSSIPTKLGQSQGSNHVEDESSTYDNVQSARTIMINDHTPRR
jgi:hypothetical protein